MEQTLNLLLPLAIKLIIAIGVLSMIWGIFRFIKRHFYVKGFPDYISVLEFHMRKAYDLIHKDRILVYSLDATKIPDKEFEVITHDFINLVRKFIGPSLIKDFIGFYGDENTFIFNMVEYFNTRYEEDSIRKQTMEELTTQDGMPEVMQYEQGTGA